MLKNSNIIRRYRYARKRKGKKWFGMLVLATIAILLTVMLFYAENEGLPYLVEASEVKARNIAPPLVEKVIKHEFSGGMRYEDLITVQKGADGNVISFDTHMAQLDLLSNQVSEKVRAELKKLGEEDLAVPIGGFFGSSILAAVGPDIYMKINMDENVKIRIKSDFTEVGENQTRHSIMLQIDAILGIQIPFREQKLTVSSSIPVAETVIMGEVPAFYMNADELPLKVRS
jgi:sporulation protein YunB